ncbi:MAG TPA: crossover junction endodeoxyribonuclease RuvC [bacterium]|nr:crossover junction endodeoxyribonuclease RuvC [bacterium]
MRVLGIDPGTVRMGVGVVETKGSAYKLVHYDVLKLSSSEAMTLRLGKIFNFVKKTISEYNVDAVSIEDVFVAVNPRSALKLGQGRGAAIAAAVDMGVEVFEYTPREIKQSVSSFGGAGKEQVAQMVGYLVGVKDIRPFDAADAIAISICHINRRPYYDCCSKR